MHGVPAHWYGLCLYLFIDKVLLGQGIAVSLQLQPYHYCSPTIHSLNASLSHLKPKVHSPTPVYLESFHKNRSSNFSLDFNLGKFVNDESLLKTLQA